MFFDHTPTTPTNLSHGILINIFVHGFWIAIIKKLYFYEIQFNQFKRKAMFTNLNWPLFPRSIMKSGRWHCSCYFDALVAVFPLLLLRIDLIVNIRIKWKSFISEKYFALMDNLDDQPLLLLSLLNRLNKVAVALFHDH